MKLIKKFDGLNETYTLFFTIFLRMLRIEYLISVFIGKIWSVLNCMKIVHYRWNIGISKWNWGERYNCECEKLQNTINHFTKYPIHEFQEEISTVHAVINSFQNGLFNLKQFHQHFQIWLCTVWILFLVFHYFKFFCE